MSDSNTSAVVKKNILLYCALSAQGGIESHILSLAAVLCAAGHEVTIGAKWVDNRTFYDAEFARIGARLVVAPSPGALLERQPLKKLGDMLRTFRLYLELRSTSFDLVALHAAGFAGRLLRRLAGPRGRVTYHEHVGAVAQHLQRPAFRRLLAMCDFVTANSRADVALLAPHGRRIVLLPALTVVTAEPEPTRMPSGEGSFRVAFVGNLAAQEKGARKLWLLWSQSPPAGCSLHLFGPGAVSAEDPAPPPGVFVHGRFPRTELARVFGQIDLLVHPADQESLGLVLVEAMAFGVPFLCTRVGGMIDLAEGNADAAFCANNQKSLKGAILAMKARIECGEIDSERLRRRYADHFGTQSLGLRWTRLYGE